MASQEWSVHHQKALALAQQARNAWRAGKKPATLDLYNRALVTEGFADHFLQDSYASGHQYPRALDAVGAKLRSDTEIDYKSEVTLLGLGRAKTYHDALCKLERGLPLKEGRFHGDHTKTGQDKRVMSETAFSLAQVIGVMLGKNLGLPNPHPSEGPDVSAILADAKVDPGPGKSPSAIWKEMTGAVASDLELAKANAGLKLETSAGTGYTAGDIAKALGK